MSEQEKSNEYDLEPVYYCATCLSLNIKHEDAINSDCCCDCGCTNIKQILPKEWEKLYVSKYGRKYVEEIDTRKKHPIFHIPFSKLFEKVLDSHKWEAIIKGIYGRMPEGYNRREQIVMFFDRLIKDNKLDSLRDLLYKMKVY